MGGVCGIWVAMVQTIAERTVPYFMNGWGIAVGCCGPWFVIRIYQTVLCCTDNGLGQNHGLDVQKGPAKQFPKLGCLGARSSEYDASRIAKYRSHY